MKGSENKESDISSCESDRQEYLKAIELCEKQITLALSRGVIANWKLQFNLPVLTDPASEMLTAFFPNHD